MSRIHGVIGKLWETELSSGREEKKESTACRLKKERPIKSMLLYHAMLSRGDISGNWKFPVGRGGPARGRLAGRKREICLTVSREIAISLFRAAPSGIGLRRREYSTTRGNILLYNIPRELDWGYKRASTTCTHTYTHTHVYTRMYVHIAARTSRRETNRLFADRRMTNCFGIRFLPAIVLAGILFPFPLIPHRSFGE